MRVSRQVEIGEIAERSTRIRRAELAAMDETAQPIRDLDVEKVRSVNIGIFLDSIVHPTA